MQGKRSFTIVLLLLVMGGRTFSQPVPKSWPGNMPVLLKEAPANGHVSPSFMVSEVNDNWWLIRMHFRMDSGYCLASKLMNSPSNHIQMTLLFPTGSEIPLTDVKETGKLIQTKDQMKPWSLYWTVFYKDSCTFTDEIHCSTGFLDSAKVRVRYAIFEPYYESEIIDTTYDLKGIATGPL